MFVAFNRSVERAFEWLRQNKKKRTGKQTDDVSLQEGMEKSDLPAMILSALLVFLPIALVALLILAVFGYFFFFR